MIQLKLKSLLILAFIAGSFPAFAQDLTRYPDDSLRYTSVFEVHLQGAYKGVIPLRLSVALDQSFTQEQKTILRKALEIYMKRGIDDSIVECTYNNSVKDLPASRERFESQVVEAQRLLSTEGIQSPSLAFISRYWDDPTSVGIGYMNLFYNPDFPYPGMQNRHYLHIALNSDHIGKGSSFYYANAPSYWAGVIGHEFLHNLGYGHPTGYSGSFIKEYGKCIQSNGGIMDIIDPDMDDITVMDQ